MLVPSPWVSFPQVWEEGVRARVRPELNIHLKLPIIQFCYSYKLTLLFKPFTPIIQVIWRNIQVQIFFLENN